MECLLSTGGLLFALTSGLSECKARHDNLMLRFTVSHTFTLIAVSSLVPWLLLVLPAMGVWGDLGLSPSTGGDMIELEIITAMAGQI